MHHFFAQKEGAFFKVLGTVSLFAILFLGKLFILEVVNFVFGITSSWDTSSRSWPWCSP